MREMILSAWPPVQRQRELPFDYAMCASLEAVQRLLNKLHLLI